MFLRVVSRRKLAAGELFASNIFAFCSTPLAMYFTLLVRCQFD